MSRLYTAAAWLKKDAINRALRTFWQAIGFTMVVGLGDVVEQLLEKVLASTDGAPVSWHEVWAWAGRAALAAIIMPVIAYLHRRKLDPSNIPSALPPVPPKA